MTADKEEDSEVKNPHQLLPFLDVLCKSSGKIWRFLAGTEAGFAVSVINGDKGGVHIGTTGVRKASANV